LVCLVRKKKKEPEEELPLKGHRMRLSDPLMAAFLQCREKLTQSQNLQERLTVLGAKSAWQPRGKYSNNAGEGTAQECQVGNGGGAARGRGGL